ncbi:MAG: helix-turn-helix domain-containing protein [Oscillospiraceae bacterium]|nr:helix-turn-helix domain-containing protein [Oscillospiraceae bacterium]
MKRRPGENDRLPIFTKRFRELQDYRPNTEFADFLGISRQTVGFYLNGDRIPDSEKLKQIAERCNVSSDWLLGLTDVRTPDTGIRGVCDTTGLSEASVTTLSSRKQWDIGCDLTDVIDFLLADERKRDDTHHHRSILNLLSFFLSYDDTGTTPKQVFTDGKIVDFTDNDGFISSNAIKLDGDIIENAVLQEIEAALRDLKRILKEYRSKESENHNEEGEA